VRTRKEGGKGWREEKKRGEGKCGGLARSFRWPH